MSADAGREWIGRGGKMQRSDAGAATIKTILTLAFLVCLIYASIKIIPVYVNSYELEDFVRQQNPFWLTQRASPDAIRNHILGKARELELPISAEQVDVEASSASVTVNLDYTVPVDLKVYTLKLHFTPSARNKSL
jgi:hypothetical protein